MPKQLVCSSYQLAPLLSLPLRTKVLACCRLGGGNITASAWFCNCLNSAELAVPILEEQQVKSKVSEIRSQLLSGSESPIPFLLAHSVDVCTQTHKRPITCYIFGKCLCVFPIFLTTSCATGCLLPCVSL